MREKFESNNNNLDNKIADIADRLMMSEKISEADMTEEIQEMQDLMILLKQTIGTSQSEEEIKARIHANLIEEWQKLGPLAKKSLWQRFCNFLESDQLTWRDLNKSQRLAMNSAMVVIALLAFALVFSPSLGGDNLTGAANGEFGILQVVLLVGGVSGVFALWFFNRR